MLGKQHPAWEEVSATQEEEEISNIERAQEVQILGNGQMETFGRKYIHALVSRLETSSAPRIKKILRKHNLEKTFYDNVNIVINCNDSLITKIVFLKDN